MKNPQKQNKISKKEGKMCKIQDAIYELVNHVKSDTLICSLGDITIEGKLHQCECGFSDCKCYDGVITLENAVVKCCKNDYKKEYRWINISSKQIKAFSFKCCEVGL